jgi:transcriptional regulator with XRE-family HTH domain
MTANTLAKKLGLSRQYVSRAEQGTYTSLNPQLLRWVSQSQAINVRDVERQYQNFQRAKRVDTVEELAPHILRRNGSEAEHLTFERWRGGYWVSPLAFAVGMCLHPDSVQKYEEGIQEGMPQQIKIALEQVKLLDPSWNGEVTSSHVRA